MNLNISLVPTCIVKALSQKVGSNIQLKEENRRSTDLNVQHLTDQEQTTISILQV